jgi:hypothetical protein
MDKVMILEGPSPDDMQFNEVAVYEFSATRRGAKEGDPSHPTAEIAIEGHQLSDDGLSLTVVLKATIAFPFEGEAIADVVCSVYGKFSRPTPFDEATVQRFRDLDGSVILWPHLRAAVSDIGRLLGLALPPLPLLNIKLAAAAVESVRAAAQPAPVTSRPRRKLRQKSPSPR